MKKEYTAYEDTQLHGWIALMISLALYASVFWLAEESLGAKALALAFLPVVVGGWYLGVTGGALSATLAFLIGALLLELKGYQDSWMILIHEGSAGTFSLYIMSLVIGYLGYRERRYKDAVNARVKVAEKFETQVSSLMGLVNITNEVLDADDLTSVLYTLAEENRKMFNADDCLISLWDASLESYYPRATAGKESTALEELPSFSESTELARFQNADILIYGKLEDLSMPWRIFSTIHPQGTLLALPLRASGQKIGILQLLYEYKHEFDPDELAYAKLISRQISQAIWKLILLEHAEKQVAELRVLHELAVVLSAANDELALLGKAISVLGTSLYPQNLTIVLLDKERNVLERKVTYQLDKNDVFDLISLGQGVTGRVAKTGVLERYDDVREAPGYIHALTSTRSEICIPIKVGREILGVINVESDELAAFDGRDERILTTVANQIGVALMRLRAEQAQGERVIEIARSNDLIQGLTEVASEMEMSSDPNAVMKQMGIALDRKGWQTLIALFEPHSQDLVIRYTSLDSMIVKKLERFGKISMQDFRIEHEKLPPYINLNENLHPVILENYISVIARFLQGFTDDMLRRVLSRTLNSEKMVLGHFPLIYREKVLGFLWLWGEDLRKDDLPTLSVFANQVAATLENARLFADVQHLAVTDGLTQLYTRRHFFELAYEEFYRARRYSRDLSVIMLDLDHFKRVNDTYGHAVGDIVLEKAAAACRETLRANDIIGRYGGEEIVILLVETNLEAAHKVGLRILENIRALIVPSPKGDVRVTVSGGVAGDDVDLMNLVDMIEMADKALYVAKESGRDRIEIASGDFAPKEE